MRGGSLTRYYPPDMGGGSIEDTLKDLVRPALAGGLTAVAQRIDRKRNGASTTVAPPRKRVRARPTTVVAAAPVAAAPVDNIKGTFHLCRLTLNPNVYAELALRRSKQNRVAAYPTVRSELRSLSFEGNSTKFIEDNVFLGRVPDRLIVGLLDTQAFNGTLNYYPFAFQKCGVTSIKQIVRGEEYPYETLELNRNDELKDWHGYFRFLQATGPMVKHGDCMVKPDEWGHASNCTLFAWNNVPSGNADSKNMNPKQAGNVKLEINFGANPAKHLTILVWAEFENIMTIDPNGAVQYNIHDI